MPQFEHYLYILECADGSLYAGYTTDVDKRVRAHQEGKGAKYTRSHAPVRLLDKARFFSKERAMSVEARFKRLSKQQKESLLESAAATSLAEAIAAQPQDFGVEPALEFVDRSIFESIDEGYRAFHTKLVPSVDSDAIAGVRTPALRKIAKALAKRKDTADFLRGLPHRLFDENQVHAFTIGLEKDYDKAVGMLDRFLPYVDNWATCDQLSVKVLAKRPEETLLKVDEWMASGHCYTIRFGMGVLMHLYLDGLFQTEHLEKVAGTRMPGAEDGSADELDIYYVDMMRAWYFAEALVKQPDESIVYVERRGEDALLDEWTRRKAIQKAIESFRIPSEMKDYLRTLR